MGKAFSAARETFCLLNKPRKNAWKAFLFFLPKAAMKRSFWRYTNTTRSLFGWNTHRNESSNVSAASTMVASLRTLIEASEGRYGSVRSFCKQSSAHRAFHTTGHKVWVVLCARRQKKHNSHLHNCASKDWWQNVRQKVNTFAASYLNTQGLDNSCLKSPASTLVDLTFQSRTLRSFSLNQLRNLSL